MEARAKRNSNIEIIKLVAVFLIILSSALPYGATYRGGVHDAVYVNLNNTGWSIDHIIFTLFRWCGQIGDTLFIAVSAWFLCDSKQIKANKPIRMILDSWILSIIGLVAAFCCMKPLFSEIVKAFFPVRFNLNWFVGCYIIYYLIHPLLNKAIEGMNKKETKKLVKILFVVYSVAGILGQAYYYTNLVGFICIHFFVLYYKRYMNAKANRSRDIRLIVAAFIGIIIWICGINILSTVTGKFSGMNLFGCTFMNPLIILMGMATLNLAVTSSPRNNNQINELSKFSLLIYLFHANYFWLTYGKYVWIGFLCNNSLSLLAAVGVTVVCYILITPCLSWIYSKMLDRVLNLTTERLNGLIERIL